MGDRISIQFVNGKEKSVVLFNHWGGLDFKETAEDYVKTLKTWANGKAMEPLQRLEPNTVMIDFIREITKNMERVTCSLYLGKDEDDGDNSDNGHFEIDLS